MKKLSHAEIAQKRLTPEQLKTAERLPVYAVLDNIRSLYNVGSIFRTSDGARVSKIYCCGYTPYPPRREIEKTALGATLTVPWEHHRDTASAVSELRDRGVRICVLEQTDRSVPYDSLSAEEFPLALVIGNEITGVTKEIVSAADRAIEIPMFGLKQSLNAAVAYGIAVYAFVKLLRPPL